MNDILNLDHIINNIHNNNHVYGELTYQQLWELLQILSDKFRFMHNIDNENKSNIVYKDQQILELTKNIDKILNDIKELKERNTILENKLNSKLTIKERFLGKINKI
jgi:hypothetical protein